MRRKNNEHRRFLRSLLAAGMTLGLAARGNGPRSVILACLAARPAAAQRRR